MEDFSLKPLSEGLGFYEDKLSIKSANKKGTRGSNKGDKEDERNEGDKGDKKPLFSELSCNGILPKELDLNNLKTYEHLLSILEKPWLGEKETIKSELKTPVKSSLLPSETLPSPLQKKEDVVPQPKLNTMSEKTFYFSLISYIMDAFVVSLLFFPPLLSFIFLTQSEPQIVLSSIWPKILIAFLFFSQIYCLMCRLFCFETFGEALVKVRLLTLGSKKEVHPFRFFWRFFLSCLTGVVFLPLFSLIFRKDLSARLTGLYFQKSKILKS